jgi:hypothetical protein
MHKREATKTSDATFARGEATKTPTATWASKMMCKCEDKSPKTTENTIQHKMLNNSGENVQSTSPSPLLG